MRRLVVFTAFVLLAVARASAEGDPENGKALIKSWRCVVCHGLTGNERSALGQAVPMLAGQPASFLLKRLKEYKSGRLADSKEEQKMSQLVQGLSDAEMMDIAAYFEAQKRY